MATNSRIAPVQVPISNQFGLIDKNWLLYLQSIASAVPANGNSNVINGSPDYSPTMILNQGLDSSKSGNPSAGELYFALDTGNIYFSNGGSWNLLSEELIGDVIKSNGSNITSLKDVFLSPGTYGSSSQTPILTIDSKGRITNIVFEQLSAKIQPIGAPGELAFNSLGTSMQGSSGITYNPATKSLAFSLPKATREALSPLTTKGDIFVRNSTESTRLPVGIDGQYLRADSTEITGLKWVSPNKIEHRFNFGDASPWLLGVISANRIIKNCSIVIFDAFNGTVPNLSIGTFINPNELLSTSDLLPKQLGTYSTVPGIKYDTDTNVYLYISPSSSNSGAGLVTLTLEN